MEVPPWPSNGGPSEPPGGLHAPGPLVPSGTPNLSFIQLNASALEQSITSMNRSVMQPLATQEAANLQLHIKA